MLRDPPRERRRRDGRRHSRRRGSDVGVRHPQDGQHRAHRALRRETAGRAAARAGLRAARRRRRLPRVDGHLPVQARGPGGGGRQPASWSTSAATSSPTRCRASACRRTSIAATGRTSGPSSRTSRPTWRCATRSRRLISTTPKRPVYTHPRFLPASKLEGCNIRSALVSEGCILHGAEIDRAIIGIRSRIGARAQIRNSLLDRRRLLRDAGRDARDARRAASRRSASATDTIIENAIIDKNARVGRGVRIINEAKLKHADGDGYFIREGIVIVPKNSSIQNGTVIDSPLPGGERVRVRGHVPLRRPRGLALRRPQDDPRDAGGRGHAGRRDRVARRREGRRGGARARDRRRRTLATKSCWPIPTSTPSTSRCPTTCTCRGPSARPRPAKHVLVEKPVALRRRRGAASARRPRRAQAC